MTPSDIEVLIHCWCATTVHPKFYSPDVQAAIRQFESDGVVELTDDKNVYQITAKGAAWLKAVCNTPYPQALWTEGELTWIDDKGKTL